MELTISAFYIVHAVYGNLFNILKEAENDSHLVLVED